MRMKTRRKKKKTGSNALPVRRIRWGTACLLVSTLLAFFAANARGADRKHKDKAENSFSIVAGTVFRDPGFSLAGAKVTITPAPDKTSAGTGKIKKMKAILDSRGEFAFRVPSVPMKYIVAVQADGFAPQEKPVEVQGGEREEVYFTLLPVSR